MIQIKNNLWIKHNSEELDIDNLINCFSKAKEFFEIDYPNVRILLLNDKNDLSFFMNKQKEEMDDWMLGRCFPEIKMIVAYSPEGIEKNTNRQKFTFRGMLTHELCHILYHEKKYNKNLHLLNEGIASYVQNILVNKMDLSGKKDIDIENSDDVDILQNFNKEIYRRGIFLVKRIIDNLGKEVLINFLERIKNIDNDKEISELFDNSILMKLRGGKTNEFDKDIG